MSGALAAGSSLFSIGSQVASSLGVMPAFIRAGRSLNKIIPDVTIEEHHSDRMEITHHPIADNTPIADHAFKLPSTVTMRMGWTNSNPIGSVVSGAVGGFASGGISGALSGAGEGLFSAFTESRAKDIYAQLLRLQAGEDGHSPQPFTLTTGKRTYPNMLIAELTVTTDRHTEYSLMVEARLEQVILVSTQTTNSVAQSNQANPSRTAGTTDKGTQQPQENNGDSILYNHPNIPVLAPPGAALIPR